MESNNRKIKVKIIIVISLIILINILIRISLTPHEIGQDTFFIHSYADSIIKYGSIKWLLNPLSIFGLYPYSYATAVPIIISEITLLLTVKTEISIFIYAIIIGCASVLFSYLLTYIITKNIMKSLIVSIIFSTAPSLLFLTTWTSSSRGLFLVLTPLFMYIILKYLETKNKKYIIISFILFILLSSTHHLYIYLVPFFIIVIIYQSIIQKIRFIHNGSSMYGVILFLIFIALILLPFIPLIKNNIPLITTKNFYTDIISVLLIYMRNTGLALFLFIIGLFILGTKNQKNSNEVILLMTIIVYAPLISFRVYTENFIIIFFAIIAIYSLDIINILKINKKYTKIILPAILLLCIFISALFQNWHPNLLNRNIETHERYLGESVYALGQFLEKETTGNIITTDEYNTNRLQSLALCRIVTGEVEPIICGFAKKEDIQIRFLSPTNTLFWKDSPIRQERIFTYYKNFLIKNRTHDSLPMIEFIKGNNIRYYINNNNINDDKYAFGKSVKKTKNNIYDSGENKIWQIN